MNSGKHPSASGLKRKFHLCAIVLLAACMLYVGLAATLLWRSGEYLPLDTLIQKQQETGGIYGPAVFMRDFYYKQRLYELRRPDIAAFGSSRVLGFRQQDFSKSFVNMGGAGELQDMMEAVDSALKIHVPKLVILGVDFSWFHPQAGSTPIHRGAVDRGISTNDLLQPLKWLATCRVNLRQMLMILRGNSPDIGIAGITQQDGYDAAGAYDETSTITGMLPPEDFQFRLSTTKVEKSEKKFAQSEALSDAQYKKFLGLVDLLLEKKIHVVLFMPPIAERVYREMDKTPGYKYVTELRSRLAALAAQRDIPFFDYHAGGPQGTQECEFKDALHGGTVIYQRMLLDMALRDSELRGRLNLAAIGWNIEHFGGQSSLRDDEIDFLGLNCTKPSIRKRL